jgi:hypothetical protein
MLLPDSFSRRPPYLLDGAQKCFVAALRYAYEITELHYGRLAAALSLVGFAQSDVSPESRVAIFADVWGAIDNLNRARQLLSAFPHIRDRVDVRQFVAEADQIRLLRNRFQHLDEDFVSGKNITKGYPIYGGLTWFNHTEERIVIIGTMIAGPSSLRHGVVMSSATIPGHWERGISNISLAAFDHNIQISRFVRLLNEVIAALDEEMSREIEDSAQKIAAERNLTVERVLRPAIADVTIALVGDLSDDRKLLTIRTSPSTPGDGEKPR